MKYELIDEENRIFARIDDDGKIRVTCSEKDKDYQAWLAEQDEAEVK